MIRLQSVATIVFVVCLAGCGKPQSSTVPNASLFQSTGCVQEFTAGTGDVTAVALKLVTTPNAPAGRPRQDLLTVIIAKPTGEEVATTTHEVTTGTSGWVVIPFFNVVPLSAGEVYSLRVHDGRNGWFGWQFEEKKDGRGTLGALESNWRVEFEWQFSMNQIR